MKKSLLAFAIAAYAAIIAPPASATTFPIPASIYFVPGVIDSGDADNVGRASSFLCTNLSGQTASIRFRVLTSNGVEVGDATFVVANTHTITVSTHATALFFNDTGTLATGAVAQGVMIISATQSAIFCSAMIVDAAVLVPNGIALHLARFNPHPGTVE